MGNFDEAEVKEREIIKRLMVEFNPKTVVMSEIGSFKPWDFRISYGLNKVFLGEMKCVNCDSGKYDCVLLELTKAKGLIYENYKEGINQPPLYCMHYTDDVVRVLKLTPQLLSFYEPQWRFLDGKNKSVYLIPIHEAHKMTL